MSEIEIFNEESKPSDHEKSEIVEFLLDHLDEFGDKKEDILKAIDFSIKEYESFGGFTLVLRDNNTITGSVVVNQTGMSGYIPENILVYIAVHRDYRGQGIGEDLMKEAIKLAKGNVALHVEPENPARYLYEKLGFSSKYLEMRLNKIN